MVTFLRICVNYILFIFGIREVLPRYFVNKIVIKESGEPLVILSGVGIFTTEEILVRETVAQMLQEVAKRLECHKYGLFVYEGYRSTQKQRELWNKVVSDLREKYSSMSESEVELLARTQVAKPDGTGGGHQTGGAVDLTIVSLDGAPFLMGTEYLEFNELTKTSVQMNDASMQKRRNILLDTMREVGFLNYPNEWWHYSYGDRMWAAYTRKKCAMYGSVKNVKK